MKPYNRSLNSYILPLLFILFLFTSQANASTKNLFNNIDLSGTTPPPLTEETLQQRPVSIPTQIFDQLKLPDKEQTDTPDVLLIDLFNGEKITAVMDKFLQVSKTSTSWIGHIKDEDSSQVILTISDNIVMGNITQAGKLYQIRYIQVANNNDASNTGIIHLLKEIDLTKIPQDHPEEYPNGLLKKSIQDHVEKERQKTAEQGSDAQADDGSVIDIMVVYTPAARTAAGGTAAMNTLIDLAVTETNLGYTTSGITTSVYLVHKEEVSYTEAASNAFSTSLSELQNTSDGIIDNVHTLRDTHAADLVALLIDDAQSCGIGYLDSTAATAFSVTNWLCATGYYSFAHEFGHNQGARHD